MFIASHLFIIEMWPSMIYYNYKYYYATLLQIGVVDYESHDMEQPLEPLDNNNLVGLEAWHERLECHSKTNDKNIDAFKNACF